jgi:NADPH:quinone reductase-like Zn-dependent oxidoreductase
MRGEPYLMRMDAGIGAPKVVRLGADFSGTVEAVGKSVTRFKPGDEIFGDKRGAFGEYISIPDDRALVLKPDNLTHEQAAAVPIAAITALQALRDQGKVKAGQTVLINGASGGVGTFAVQIAKTLGAEVTGVCSTRNAAIVRSLGADYVIDYTKVDVTRSGKQYDVIVDTVGNRALLDMRRALKPKGIFVIVGGPEGAWLGGLIMPIKAAFIGPFVSQEFKFFLADVNQNDLGVLNELLRSGKLIAVIDRQYPLSETAAAIKYLEAGHARGKVIITIQ